MSAPQWKPGDVALMPDGKRAVFAGRCLVYGRGEFANALIGSRNATEARPLVVIDPEDRAQVERLARAWCEQFSGRGAPLQPEETWHMQEALRSLVTPPKPEEPQGLGAVVFAECGGGKREYLTRVCVDGLRHCWVDEDGSHHSWRNMHDVEVKREGWRA